MKNFYFFFLFLGGILIGCSDNEGNPGGDGVIKYLELPKVDSIWKPFDVIEIYGIGFNHQTQLWFRPLGSLGESDEEANFISVSPGGVRFRAGWIYGEQEIILGHEGVNYVLGTLIFIDEPVIPIDGIRLPQVDSIWNPGDIITIEGIGFTEESEIWLYNANTYGTVNSKGTKADIYSLTAISLSIVAPSVYNEQEVILIHEGEAYDLGNLMFAEEKVIYHLSKIIQYEGNQISEELFKYDSQNRIVEVTISSWEEGEEVEVTTVNYEYIGSQIIREDIDEGISLFTVYDLTEEGLVYMVTYNETGNEYVYEYNGENQIIKIMDYVINWQDGNIRNIEGQVNYTYNYYTYAWNANMNVSLFIGNFEPILDKYVFGQGFLGKTNANLMSRYTFEDTYTYIYEYEFEGEKVVKITEYILLASDEREERRSWVMEYR